MPSPKGANIRHKTPKARQKLFKNFCEHIQRGYTIHSFPDADHKTLLSYMQKFPEDLPVHLYEEAKRKSRLWWEEVGNDGMLGKIKNFNHNVWRLNVQNRYGYAERREVKHEGYIEVSKLSEEELDSRIKALQDNSDS